MGASRVREAHCECRRILRIRCPCVPPITISSEQRLRIRPSLACTSGRVANVKTPDSESPATKTKCVSHSASPIHTQSRDLDRRSRPSRLENTNTLPRTICRASALIHFSDADRLRHWSVNGFLFRLQFRDRRHRQWILVEQLANVAERHTPIRFDFLLHGLVLLAVDPITANDG